MTRTLFASGVGPVMESEFPYWGREKLTTEDTIDLAVQSAMEKEAAMNGITVEQLIQTLIDSSDEIETEEDVYQLYKDSLLESLTYSEFDDWSIDPVFEDGTSTRNL